LFSSSDRFSSNEQPGNKAIFYSLFCTVIVHCFAIAKQHWYIILGLFLYCAHSSRTQNEVSVFPHFSWSAVFHRSIHMQWAVCPAECACYFILTEPESDWEWYKKTTILPCFRARRVPIKTSSKY